MPYAAAETRSDPDMSLARRVSTRLERHRALFLQGPAVSTQQGAVVIEGVAADDNARWFVGELVWRGAGVRNVSNQLRVRHL